MFTKTNKQRKSVIITAILALIVLLAGLFCVFKDDKKTVSASADTGFYFEEGMALSTEVGNMQCRFTVNITQEMYDKLSVPADPPQKKWGITWVSADPNDYYLRVTRSDGYYIDYNIDPDYSLTSSWQLELDGDNLIAYLAFPIGSVFTYEYTYSCSYMKIYTASESHYGVNVMVKKFDTISTASNTVTRSAAYVANKVLENDAASYDDDQIEWLKTIAGLNTSSGNFDVTLKWQTLKDFGYIEETTELYSIDSRFILDGGVVYEAIKTINGKQLGDYDVEYEDKLGNRTILLARDYEYEYDEANHHGYLTIVYDEYKANEFAIRVKDNDELDGVNLYLYAYTTDIWREDGDEEDDVTSETDSLGTKWKLTFNYLDIISWCNNSVESWLFKIYKDPDNPNNNYSAINVDDSRVKEHITVTVGANELTVEFYEAYMDELKNLSITLNAEVVSNHELTMNVNYTQLLFDGNTIIDETVTDTYKIWWKDFVLLNSWGTFQETVYYTLVKNALNVSELGDEIYFISDNVVSECVYPGVRVWDEETKDYIYTSMPEYNLNVHYSYNTLFAVKDSVSGAVHFIDCTLNTLEYKFEDLKLTPPDGYRLAALESDDSLVDVDFAEDDAENASVKLKVNSKQKLIIPITATYSDKWYLDIVYLKPYKNTPFAVKTTETFEVGVNDYEDIENMKKADILALLGRDSMVVGNIADADAFAHAELTSSSTYTCTVTYGVASWRQVDYEGKGNELRIPLSSYADWCASFGEDWTIMYLNKVNEDKVYFEYTNEVEREDLYGFFSIAIFDRQVSNLNYYFANSGGDGSAIIYQKNEVKGDAVYKFFDNMRGKGVVTSFTGYVGMAFCELVNDNNKVQHSVAFYLDGTTKHGGITDNGSDDPNNTNSAFENATKDFFDKIGDGIKKGWKKFLKYVAIGLGCIVGGGIVIGVGVKLGKKFYRWATTDKPKPQATEQPKKQPTKKKKKKRSGSNKRKSKK